MKKAFTIMEIIIVILIVSILASVVIPRTGSNRLAEAATQVISDIRYTQHLAMIDDKHNESINNWYIARWQILFQLDNSGEGNYIYSVYTDKDRNDAANPSTIELAINPLSGKLMTGNSIFSNRTKAMDLTGEYGISSVSTAECANGSKRIFFDYLGRPHVNNNTLFDYLLNTQCKIVLINSDGNITIAIEPETGYAHILYNIM